MGIVPVEQLGIVMANRPVVGLPTGEVAWMNQATWHHCHFGLKPASHGFAAGTPVGDFRPGIEGVI